VLKYDVTTDTNTFSVLLSSGLQPASE